MATGMTISPWKKGKGVQIGGPDKAGKRQPRLTPGRENGNDVRTLELEFVALNELEEHPDPLCVFRPVEKRRYIFGQAIEIQLLAAPG